MTSLIVLAACAAIPWILCAASQALWTAHESAPPATVERALRHYRRATLLGALVLLPASAIAGALLVDPSLSTRSPIAGSWFFASLSAMTAWVSLALSRRTPEEAAAMSHLETTGRAVQMAAVPVLATGLSLLAFAAVEAWLPLGPIAQALTAGLLAVGAVIVVSPWLAMKLGFWPVFPERIDAAGVSWRLAHLPAPSPFLTHVAALPWLRTALVSDGLFNRAPVEHWQTLVRYEVGSGPGVREGAARWAVAIPMSLIVFISAGAAGADDPRKLVAAMVLAVFFTATASWFANRQPASKLTLAGEGPSMQELAQTLRSLPPCLGQALPRTAHHPLGSALYDRLFALGHDPGRRPHR